MMTASLMDNADEYVSVFGKWSHRVCNRLWSTEAQSAGCYCIERCSLVLLDSENICNTA